MKLYYVCSWCKKPIGDSPAIQPTDSTMFSHGICSSCKTDFLKDWSKKRDNHKQKEERTKSRHIESPERISCAG